MDISKNTVPADNQLRDNIYTRILTPENTGKRIMFLGNSITLHEYKPSIGWHNEWGMAASAKEKDYVHILMDYIQSVAPDAVCAVCQGGQWELNYTAPDEKLLPQFQAGRDFDTDIIVMRLMENVSTENLDMDFLAKKLEAFLNFLAGDKGAKILLTTAFWKHPGDEATAILAEKLGYPLIPLGDLGDRDEMMALGLFEHSGVAMHPGDLGMQTIADRIWAELKMLL